MTRTPLLTQAYCLHSRPYRETSLLLQLFSQAEGRIDAVAKGARRASGRRAPAVSLLQPFVPLQVGVTGQSSLKTLVSVEPSAAAGMLAGDALLAGFYLNELLVRLLPEQAECGDIYAAYERALGELAAGRAIDLALRRFEFDLLDGLGYGIPFVEVDERGRDCGALSAALTYRFVPDAGFVRNTGAAAEAETCDGRALLAVAERAFDAPDTRRLAKQLARRALAPLLGDKPLNSRMLFR